MRLAGLRGNRGKIGSGDGGHERVLRFAEDSEICVGGIRGVWKQARSSDGGFVTNG